MDNLNSLETFMMVIATPFIAAAIWRICSKYFSEHNKHAHKH